MATTYTAQRPVVQIGGTGPTDAFECHMNAVTLTATDTQEDAETFCAPGLTIPGATTWTFTGTFVRSYGTDGSWNLLHAMRKTEQVVTLRGLQGVVSDENPQAVFTITVPTIPFLETGGVGSTDTFTMTAITVGEPVITTA